MTLAFAGQAANAVETAQRLLQRPHPTAIDERVRPALVHALFSQGRWEDILTAVTEALEVPGLRDGVRGRLLAERALARIWTGDAVGAEQDAEEALALGDATGDATATSLGLGHPSVLATHEGRLEQAVELARRGLDAARGGPRSAPPTPPPSARWLPRYGRGRSARSPRPSRCR